MTDRDVRERCAEIVSEFIAAWTSDPTTMIQSKAVAGVCESIRQRILDLPLTSAREVTDEIVERAARAHSPSLWAMIDNFAADDDWMGGTSLNARGLAMRAMRAALEAALLEAP